MRTKMGALLSTVASVVALLLFPAPTQADPLPEPTLRLADSAYPTFHDSTDLCDDPSTEVDENRKVRIDGPVRMYEDANHTLHMTVTGPDGVSHQWTGSVYGFNNRTAKLDCDPVLDGPPMDNNPAHFNQKHFIQGIHYKAGQVTAYTHQDYYGKRTKEAGCDPLDKNHECWYSSVGAWRSGASGHLDFSRLGNAIYPSVQYPGHAATPPAGWLGYGTPSNIFRGRGVNAGYWYMFTRASVTYPADGSGQRAGSCLWRTSDPTDISSWRSADVGLPSTNPYTGLNTPCNVVSDLGGAYVRSVVWHAPSQRYIAVYRTATDVVYSSSPDLQSWSDPKVLLHSTWEQANYPVLVDLSGGDWGDDNFDRAYSDGKMWLFYRKDIPNSSYGHHRLVHRKVEIGNYDPDPSNSQNRG